MTEVAGVDGCKDGWVVVRRGRHGAVPRISVAVDLAGLFRDETLACIGIDVPIGLLDAAVPGGRACDAAARAYLGPKRSSSVFSAPVRPVLRAVNFDQAVATSRASSVHQLALSRQSFAIVPKIAEVDRMMSPQLQKRVVEVHPECSFAALNGGAAVTVSKKRVAGRAVRSALLQQAWGLDVGRLVQAHRSPGVQPDDILDAMAACWTADRVQRGVADRLPERSVVDASRLRMEIWI